MPEIRTTIESVVVYPDRARILRRGALPLEPGTHRVEILDHLPTSLDPSSVRAAARGTGRGQLAGVDVTQRFVAETPAEKLRALESQIEALTDELNALQSRQDILTNEHAKLLELEGQGKAFAKGLATGSISPEVFTAFLDRVRHRAEAISASLIELNALHRKKERQLQSLQGEMGQLKPDTRKCHFAVIDVDVFEAGDFELDLVYVVSRAGWEPLYDVRLIEEGAAPVLEIGYLGQIKQQTGEDWQDVCLTLSTARPAVSTSLPELKPWYIGPVQPPPPPPAVAGFGAGLRAAAQLSMKDMAEADAAAQAAPMVIGMEETAATVDSQGTAVTYQLPGRSSVPSDATPRKVTVARYNLAPEMDYTAAPKLLPLAYRRAKASNDSEYTLLPGRASLFAGQEYIGSTRLELVAPKGEMEFSLGTDDRIHIQRELTRRQVDKRFATNRRRIHYGYDISIHNLLPTPAMIALYDQLPNPTHEAISVQLESAQPQPDDMTDLNILRWDVPLSAGEKKALHFEFVVEHPQDMVTAGLP